MERLGDWVIVAYHSITNVSDLLSNERLLSVCAVLDASMVCSRLQLAVAIQRLNNNVAASGGQLRSRTMHSELMLMLSPTRNITEAMRLFSMDDKKLAHSSDAAVVGPAAIFAMHAPHRDDIALVTAAVKGASLPLAQLSAYANQDAIVKAYGIGAPELSHCGLESCVVNRIAISDI